MTAADPSLRRLSYPLKPRPFSEPSDFYLLPLSAISTSGTGSVQKFSASGEFLTKWGGFGFERGGEFDDPVGLAVDASGNIYVADAFNDRIQVFSASGEFLGMWGTSGEGNGEFDFPNDVAVDGQGNAYVADSGNNRVQKFSVELLSG